MDQTIQHAVAKAVAALILLTIACVMYIIYKWWKHKATVTQKQWVKNGILYGVGVPVALCILTWIVEVYAIVVTWAWNLIWPF